LKSNVMTIIEHKVLYLHFLIQKLTFICILPIPQGLNRAQGIVWWL
jgi:hypothetical protein